MIRGPAILLFRGKGIISALIRWQTRGPYSHAAFLLPDGKVIEAWHKGGVRLRPPLSNFSNVDAFYIAGMTKDQWQTALDYAYTQVGKGYDWWGIIRFISRNKMPDNDRWFCSELVFDSLQKAGVNLFDRIAGWAVAPGLLSISTLLKPILPITEESEVAEEREIKPEPLPEPSPAQEEAPVVK